MPGVPSGRGCDACRKQKKKCDQVKPLCGRCARLQVPCIGAGKQRYVFRIETTGSPPETGPRSASQQVVRRKTVDEGLAVNLKPPPADKVTLLTMAFCDTIAPSTEYRYNLATTYGTFFQHLPSRLGREPHLDAAVQLLVSAHRDATRRQAVGLESIQHHSTALRSLNAALQKPEHVRSVGTLCTVMVLVICQALMSRRDDCTTSHCEGAIHLLRARGFHDRRDAFEQQLMLSLRGPMLFQALVSKNMDLPHNEWRRIAEIDEDPSSMEAVMMRCMVNVVIFRQIKQNTIGDWRCHPEYDRVCNDCRKSRVEMTAVVDRLRDLTIQVRDLVLQKGSSPGGSLEQTYLALERAYAVATTITIVAVHVVNTIEGGSSLLQAELSDYREATLALARRGESHGPLNAWVPLCILTAWPGTTVGSTMRASLEEAYMEHQSRRSPGHEVEYWTKTMETESSWLEF